MGHLDWMDEAPCREVPTEVFFPPDHSRDSEREAKSICSGCPVRHSCLAWALTYEKNALSRAYGIYGGLTARERVRMIRAARLGVVHLPEGTTLRL